VLVGLTAVRAGYPIVDPIVAVIIAGVIAWTAVQVLWETSQSLTDMARLDPHEVRQIVMTHHNVIGCHDIRTRGLPHHIFMDLSIQVPPTMTVAEAHDVAHQVEQSLKKHFDGVAEVIVHVAPDESCVAR
jgi:cation diffusion facilitator family transporter